MRAQRWLAALCCCGMLATPFSGVLAKDHDKDKDNGHYRAKHKDKGRDDDDDRRGYGYSSHDRDEIRGWYADNSRRLPPGLAKKDRLPPGLERQLVVRGHFPPGLERDVRPVPVELERRLPPPPPDCERVVVDGHIVLRNHSTNIVLDIFHLE